LSLNDLLKIEQSQISIPGLEIKKIQSTENIEISLSNDFFKYHSLRHLKEILNTDLEYITNTLKWKEIKMNTRIIQKTFTELYIFNHNTPNFYLFLDSSNKNDFGSIFLSNEFIQKALFLNRKNLRKPSWNFSNSFNKYVLKPLKKYKNYESELNLLVELKKTQNIENYEEFSVNKVIVLGDSVSKQELDQIAIGMEKDLRVNFLDLSVFISFVSSLSVMIYLVYRKLKNKKLQSEELNKME